MFRAFEDVIIQKIMWKESSSSVFYFFSFFIFHQVTVVQEHDGWIHLIHYCLIKREGFVQVSCRVWTARLPPLVADSNELITSQHSRETPQWKTRLEKADKGDSGCFQGSSKQPLKSLNFAYSFFGQNCVKKLAIYVIRKVGSWHRWGFTL